MLTLEELLSPSTPDEFFLKAWPDRPAHYPGDPQRFTGLLQQVPELGCAEDVLRTYGDCVSVLRPDGFYAKVADGPSALPFYRAEFTCFLRQVERFLPTLQPVAGGIAAQLGLPESALTCDLFVSSGRDVPASDGYSGLAMHSDAEVSIAVLLNGRKDWQWAPNRHIRNQTSTVVRRGDRQVDPAQLEFAESLPLPGAMPSDSARAQVDSGGVIFMPRDWWHTTTARGECVQLNFTASGPMWVALLTGALSDVLVKDVAWRGYAYGLVGSPAQRESAVTTFEDLVDGLATLLRSDGAARRLLDAAVARQAI